MDHCVRQKAHRLFIPLAVALRAVIRWVEQQLNRLLKLWVVEAGIDPSDYSVELTPDEGLPFKGTGDLQTVRALLGLQELRAQRDISVQNKGRPNRRSVGPSISDAVLTKATC